MQNWRCSRSDEITAISLPVEKSAASRAAVPAGLSSAEAAHRRAEFGPNAGAEERVPPLKQVARHSCAAVPWMLEATIALQIVIGERLGKIHR